MTRATGILCFAVLATPALAAGNGFDGVPWWVALAVYGPVIAIPVLLSVGLGFFLQGFLRLRNALISLIVVSVCLLAWLATVYGFEKVAPGVTLLASCLTLVGPFFGLGWFIGIKDAARRSSRGATLNTGNNHG
jgi:hypothetical protein